MSTSAKNMDKEIKAHELYGKWIDARLAVEGPALIRRLTVNRSLRSVAREAGLSVTYLSMVERGKAIISHGAFVRLAKFERGAL